MGSRGTKTKSTSKSFDDGCENNRWKFQKRIRFSSGDKLDKPVIYLYPENPMDISIELKIKNSKFTCVYPKFNGKNKWKVHAKPNGDIMISDKIYPYLFWEAQSYNKTKYE